MMNIRKNRNILPYLSKNKYFCINFPFINIKKCNVIFHVIVLTTFEIFILVLFNIRINNYRYFIVLVFNKKC